MSRSSAGVRKGTGPGAGGCEALFRLAGTARRDAAVDAWLASHSGELGARVRYWFDRMRRCGDDVREVLHDGRPVACVADAAFACVGVFTRHAHVGFFRGAVLPDPGGLLEGSGRRMRHVKLRPGDDGDEAALQGLIEASYADIRACLARGAS